MEAGTRRGRRVPIADGTALWYLPANRSRAQNLLLIHGFRGDHHGLLAIAAALQEFNVLIPDLPGYGRSPELGGEHSVENYSKWLLNHHAILKQQFGPMNLVAHSFGTQIAAKAFALGLRPKSVTLLNPITEVAAKSSAPAKKLTSSAYAIAKRLGALGSALFRSWPLVQMMSSSLALTKDRGLRSEIHRQHHRYFSSYRSDRVVLEGFVSASESSINESEIPKGALVVAGERDIVAPIASLYQLIAGRADLRLVVIPTAGHLVHYEQPAEVADLIRGHITKTSAEIK